MYNYEQCSEVLHKADVQENVDDNMLPPPSHTCLISCDTLSKGQSITANLKCTGRGGNIDYQVFLWLKLVDIIAKLTQGFSRIIQSKEVGKLVPGLFTV